MNPGVRLCAIALLAALAFGGCKDSPDAAGKAAPPPEVGVLEITPAPVTVNDEYVAQTEAPDTIEIRSQVAGLLERQAFADGAPVRKGDVLYVIDQRPFQIALAQAKANLAQAQANYINAHQKLERYQGLRAQNFVSQLDYDATVAADKSAAAAVEGQRALVQAAEINLEFTVIRAAREGFMSKSLVKPGALIKVQDTLLDTLYSSDPMYVYFSISEPKLAEFTARLQQGGTVDTTTPFRIRLVDGSEYKFPGKLNFFDATIDEKSGTLRARVAIPNPDRVLRPGQFVRVIVPAVELARAIRVPQKAVRDVQGLKTVFVVGADDKAASREITARVRIENDWVVESGLSAGERVVVEGTQKVRAGAAVKPVLVTAGAAAAGPAPSPAAGDGKAGK